MTNALRVAVFVIVSAIYWVAAAFLVGGFTYASICHYPDTTGCRSDFTLPVVLGIAAIAAYVAACWGFVDYLRRNRGFK